MTIFLFLDHQLPFSIKRYCFIQRISLLRIGFVIEIQLNILGFGRQFKIQTFNYGEFATIKSQADLNSYKLIVIEWVEKKITSRNNDMKDELDNWKYQKN